MTTPGPKPKTKAMRAFEGNPGNVPINHNEPKVSDVESLDYVNWMKPDSDFMTQEKFPVQEVAKMIWDELAIELDKAGILKSIDKGKLARYCDTFARWLKMKAFLDKNGEAFPVYGGQFEPVRDEYGKPVMHPDGVSQRHEFKKYLKKMSPFPQVAIYTKLMGELRRYEEEFGIGASSRSRIMLLDLEKNTPPPEGAPPEGQEFNYAARASLIKAVK